MSCLSKIFVVLMTFFFILALGCIQELERPNRMTDTITPTATPVVIVKYLERPTIIPSELPTVSPTEAPTIVPASAPAPAPPSPMSSRPPSAPAPPHRSPRVRNRSPACLQSAFT